jgi:hypothetical protein
MEQTISQMFQSPVFWIGTVVVGLIMNLLSNRLSRHIDKWTDGWSEKRQKKLEKETAEYRQRVERLSRDQTALIISFIRGYTRLLVVLILTSSLLVMGFVGAIRPPTEPVAATVHVVNAMLFVFVIAILAMLRLASKGIKMSRQANALRIKAQETIRAQESDTNPAEGKEGSPTTTQS